MTCHLHAVSIDANDPLRLGTFWAGVLGRELDDSADGVALLPSDGPGYRIEFPLTQEPKLGPNQIHFDVTSTSLEDQQRTVARALELGGRHLDIGQDPDDGHVVLADPEGNEFCVIEAENNFLAHTGRIGAINCDGSQEVGYFWAEALGWRLVWDQDEETAIQSPLGGSKVSWGGPPLSRRPARTDCISTSPPPPAVTSRRRSTGSSPSARPTSTSVRATSTGWSWPTPTATSSVS